MPTLRRRCLALPPYAPGSAIGLFGGSFDPPHAGHRAGEPGRAPRGSASTRSGGWSRRGNPLKRTRRPPTSRRRIAAAARGRRPSRASRSPASRRRSARATRPTPAPAPAAAPRRLASSGSWAPTTSPSSTAGRTGRRSPQPCRSPSSTGPGSLTRPGRRPPRGRLPATALPTRDAASLADIAPPAWVFSARPAHPALLDRNSAARDGNRAPRLETSPSAIAHIF